jgi:peptidoglycan/LPS O-acetylase OafA/YrhL
MQPKYLKGLDGIRAIACIVVLVFHIDQFLPLFGLRSLGYHATGMAGYSVILFFVLSGFLITYLLLIEKRNSGRIDTIRFYKRRMLRIWPVYYLVVVVAAVLVSSGILPLARLEFRTALGNYLLLGPNISFAFGLSILSIVPLWSVGVEEQFYSFWPLVINGSGKIFRALVKIIILYLILKVFLRYMENGIFYKLVSLSSFDSMALGGIFAFLAFSESRILKVFYHPLVQLFAWAFLLVSILYKPVHVATLLDNEMHSFFYAILILNLSMNPNSLLHLEHRIFRFLGKISYGIYMYHMTVVVLLSFSLRGVLSEMKNASLQYALVFIAVISLTLFISHISFRYFENIFLRWKFSLTPVVRGAE